jgi:hypothetical protein
MDPNASYYTKLQKIPLNYHGLCYFATTESSSLIEILAQELVVTQAIQNHAHVFVACTHIMHVLLIAEEGSGLVLLPKMITKGPIE